MHFINHKNEEVFLEDISQQYLSNIYWFHKVIWNRSENSFILIKVLNEINRRFGGKILDWDPLPIPNEEHYIRKLAIVDDAKRIWFKGECIGKLK